MEGIKSNTCTGKTPEKSSYAFPYIGPICFGIESKSKNQYWMVILEPILTDMYGSKWFEHVQNNLHWSKTIWTIQFAIKGLQNFLIASSNMDALD